MKNLCLFFIMLIIAFICHAQDTLKRNVPLLKESSKIDSLINSAIKYRGNSKTSENDSCILLGLFKTTSDAGFTISLRATNQKTTIFDFSNWGSNKNLGYFEFGGYLVFVYGDGFMKEFFTSTKSKKEFTFIKPTTQEAVYEITHSIWGWAVFYEDGAFHLGVH